MNSSSLPYCPNRVKVLRLTSDVFLSLLKEGKCYIVKQSGLPIDAQIVQILNLHCGGLVDIYLHSESFGLHDPREGSYPLIDGVVIEGFSPHEVPSVFDTPAGLPDTIFQN